MALAVVSGEQSLSALHRIAKSGDVKELKAALRKSGKGSIDKKDEWEQTPLHVGCFEGHFSVVKVLVKAKSNVNARDKNNWTPLHAAASGLTSDHVKVCGLLLDKGADASAKTNDGSCPLHYFVRMDPKNVTEFHKVLERMAVGDSPVERARTVNTQNRHGESPLHHAAIKGREHAVLFLHHLGADINLKNKYGESSLVVAIRSARADMVRLLLSLGGDPRQESDAGAPLDLARSTGNEEIINAIQEFIEERKGNRLRGKTSAPRAMSPRSSSAIGSQVGLSRKAHARAPSEGSFLFGSNQKVITDYKSDEDDDDDSDDDDDDDSDDSEESEGEGESGEKASSPEAEPRSAGFGFIVPDDNGDQADGKATDGEAAKHDDHAHEKKGVPCTLCSTLIRHPKIEIKPKSESKDTNGEEAAKNSPGKRYHFHARCPAEWDEGNNGSQSGDGDKGKPRKGWRWVRSAAHPSPSELWNINYNQLSLDLCIIVKSAEESEKEGEEEDHKRKYFVRGLIHIPTLASASSSAKDDRGEGEGEGLTWGVWVRVNEETFKWIVTTWDKDGREHDDKAKGFTGEIATRLPTYLKDTLGLKVQLKIQPAGRRPTLVVLDAHPLAAQQKNGITRKKLLQTVHAIQDATM
ncbi:ankyrin repeat-containing protein [Acanthamoeba castellanii str. Neff]|uniref:Ankyrin repeat-containing protein n=1 Tax=Acanthamoeba castellanii (strain ATCC 30010 / Neff) TaxID=1257118 RepID=L8GIW9_ACACF|nr:ankyrin repeat-containing protein [Acanthamoeba castellanii str. Neff]ELR12091.1 ankyrin repeat-containing protein [Acanthamoeba castellanii str. Neff]